MVTTAPGTIYATIHNPHIGPTTARELIVWDPAWQDDPRTWLVTWSTTAADETTAPRYRYAHKPSSEPFLIRNVPDGLGHDWTSLSVWEPSAGRWGDAGMTRTGTYVAAAETSNGAAVMAASLARRVEQLAHPEEVLRALGGQYAAATAQRRRVLAALGEAVPVAADEGLNEVKIAALAQVDRMTVRKYLGKRR